MISLHLAGKSNFAPVFEPDGREIDFDIGDIFVLIGSANPNTSQLAVPQNRLESQIFVVPYHVNDLQRSRQSNLNPRVREAVEPCADDQALIDQDLDRETTESESGVNGRQGNLVFRLQTVLVKTLVGI